MKLSDIIQIMKLPLKYLISIFLILLVLLFSPDIFLNSLGLSTLVEKYRTILGLAFLCDSFFIISELGCHLYKILYAYYQYYSLVKLGKRKLNALTPGEKKILSSYIKNQSKTQDLPINNGVVAELASKKIIYRSTELSSSGLFFSYNLNDWAWDYLNKNPNLLK
ncbi:superinfection exclusion B family protein [Clostridium perfringens]|uniref:super-infection exclusion protein B n=2 Tax=Clostridium perfringens TaxID=1502 RepID=UPI0024BC6994|nr:super-infection exclusion protein B [Clostridium perfringens]EJT6502744.1 superinfection exclusion B family protein [Clostridium perfringens]ELC8385749.1 superinfection exclusion B family protein [Clostridium perfringens]MDK0740548.1 super-infection exclusion protein B [Clostridium perfringens]